MQAFRQELIELKKPTARCFKGISILMGIWAIASLLICALVPTIIFAHMDEVEGLKTYSVDNEGISGDDNINLPLS